MRVSLAYATTSLCAAALLSGCGGDATPTTAPMAQTMTAHAAGVLGAISASPFDARGGSRFGSAAASAATVHWFARAKTPLFYVSDAHGGVVDIFDQAGSNQTMVGQITGLNEPYGMASNARGDIFVANYFAQQVLEFGPGKTSPKLTLNDTGLDPIDPAVALNGDVAVTNSTNGNGPGSIALYHKRQTNSYLILTCALFAYPFFDAWDAAGDLYVDGEDASGGGHVAVFKSGSTSCSDTGISVSGGPGGLQVDKANDLLVDDQVSRTISVYPNGAPPASQTINLSSVELDPVTFALARSEADFFTADAAKGNAYRWTYPGGVNNDVVSIGGFPYGVTVSPGVKL